MIRKLKVGDTVSIDLEAYYNEERLLEGEIIKIENGEVMISGYNQWFPQWQCKILKFAS